MEPRGTSDHEVRGLAPGTEEGTQPPETSPGGGAPADARVDEAVARLADLAGLPVAEHPAVFEYVHERLTEALGDLDVRDPAGPGSPAPRPGVPGG